jgi:CRP/FNR family transcriptional regulator, cyclic AMP receptor protein
LVQASMLRRLIGQTRPTQLDDTARQWKLDLLSESEIFRDLTMPEMKEIERATTMTTCRRGRPLYSVGDQAEVLFILKKGKVQVYRIAEDGRRLVMATLGPGSIFGEMPLLSQRMEDGYAEALEDSTICIMSRSDVENLLLTRPQVSLNLIRILAARVTDLEDRLEMQAFQSVTSRLAATLIRLSGETTEIKGASHQQIAETIGASRETVTRALGDFRSQGLVELGRGRIEIRDKAGLRALIDAE